MKSSFVSLPVDEKLEVTLRNLMMQENNCARVIQSSPISWPHTGFEAGAKEKKVNRKISIDHYQNVNSCRLRGGRALVRCAQMELMLSHLLPCYA